MKTRQSLKRLSGHPSYLSALEIIRTLTDAGATAVFAGGCVRDALRGRSPKDLDIATSASPDVVEQSFAKTLAVGKEFGTIVVVTEEAQFEVTTFRREGPYHDGRRPSSVAFTDMEEDARRRDFTVNAMFYDPLQGEVLDFVDGQRDLEAKVLRTVGSAVERFGEDRLRMLRAIRFVGQLGFQLDKDSLKAIQVLHPQLASVSAERVLNEAKRLLASDHLALALGVLQDSLLANSFWPEIQTLDIRQLKNFGAFSCWENAFATLMVLSQSQDAEARLRHWKASRDSIRRVQEQLRGLRTLLDPLSTRSDRMRALGIDHMDDLLLLAAGVLSLQGQEEKLQHWIAQYLEVADGQGRLPKPVVTGEDLLHMGVQPGAQMGSLIKMIYDEQLEGRLMDKTAALERARQLLQ